MAPCSLLMPPSFHATGPFHMPIFLPRNPFLSLYNPVNLIGLQDPAQRTSSLLLLVIVDLLSPVLFLLFFFCLFLDDYYIASNTAVFNLFPFSTVLLPFLPSM